MLAYYVVATYKTAYDKLYDAAGIEAYGCANITTGLIQPGDVVKMLNGDASTMEAVGNQLNWTIDHKAIFESQYIVDLDGNILALDDNLRVKGFKPGDTVPLDEKCNCNAVRNEASDLLRTPNLRRTWIVYLDMRLYLRS